MSSPFAPKDRVCPRCDATLRGQSDRCWLCDAPLRDDPAVASKEPTSAERHALRQFSLSSLLMIITLLAVVLGVTRLAPGVGIILAIVTAPALIRTCIVATLKKSHGMPMETADKMALFFTSFGGVVIVAVAACVAFYITCWGGFLAGSTVSEGWAKGYESLGWGLGTGIITGAIVGIAVVYLLLRRLWFPKARVSSDTKGVADEPRKDE